MDKKLIPADDDDLGLDLEGLGDLAELDDVMELLEKKRQKSGADQESPSKDKSSPI